jgi:glucose-fructose oxidoreductase
MKQNHRSRRDRGRKIRYAVVGQGYFAQSAILPAFAHARHSELTALFSDDESKLRALKRRYGVEHALPYDEFDEFLASGAIDAVYIALPNDMHAEYTLRAAQAGVHVLCEKPIAANSREAERMIAACARAGVKLMVAYRLHYEAANLSAIAALARGKIGEPRLLSTSFSQQVTPDNSRTHSTRVGGPLRDIGIYCINAARYLFRDEPLEAVALSGKKAGDARFHDIDEQVSALLRFPGDRLAQLSCSFGAYHQSSYTVLGSKGVLRLRPAYAVHENLVLEIEAGGSTTRKLFKKRDQVAPELDELSDCIRNDRDPEPSGREGLADMRVIEAIEASVESGGIVTVDRIAKKRRPDLRQNRRAPAHRGRPTLVNVQPPARH